MIFGLFSGMGGGGEMGHCMCELLNILLQFISEAFVIRPLNKMYVTLKSCSTFKGSNFIMNAHKRHKSYRIVEKGKENLKLLCEKPIVKPT